MQYISKFYNLHTKLLANNGQIVSEQEIDLKGLVKLHPPHNLTLQFSNASGLWLYWDISSKVSCTESKVRYRKSKDTEWQESLRPIYPSPYNVPFPDETQLYEFQVQTRISHFCGKSDFWSDWSPPVYWGSNSTGVSCLIPNEEYVRCTWNENGRPDFNYSFQSRLEKRDFMECPKYLQQEGYRVGCRMQYISKFYNLHTKLLANNGQIVSEQKIDLKGLVKLHPPHNLTLQFSNASGLWLYWDISSKESCTESKVRYRKSKDTEWQESLRPIYPSPYNVPFPDETQLYEFQVQTRISHFCGKSDFWSDWSPPVYWGSNSTGVSCLIPNEEYVRCTWNENGRPDFNYSFQSRLEKRDFMECPKYLQQEGYRVGCRMQYISKFYNLHTKLLANNDQIVSEQEIDLKGLVKLHPPHNLTLHFSNASGLWLYWNISSKDSCTESKVRYRKSKDTEWQESLRPIYPSPYNVPFPDETQLYEFQVQTRISHFCGKSDFWSDWSPPVYWGSNSTGVSCLIPNEEYVRCTWNENGRPDFNYSFQSRLEKRDFMECPKYLQQEGYRVGCRMQYISKFYNLHTKLLANNGQIVSEQKIDLKGLVKLHPPHNLTLQFSNASGLWLYWDISSKESCTESKVRYRKSKDIEWQESLRQIHPSPYNVPFPDETQLYEFQVQTRISHFCGKSDFWSDWSPPVYWGSNSTGVSCLIPNEEYVRCTWNENGRPDFNYSFQSRLEKRDFMECPKYLQQEGYRVGCRMQYISKFYNLHTKLLANNGQIVSEQEIDLKGLVKLHPPHNLTLQFSNASGLWLYWDISSKESCTESKVRYRKSKDTEWQESLRPIYPSPYNVPFPDETQLYEFQVQTRISHFCGKSDFWSDWSPPVYWGSNSTGVSCLIPNEEYVRCTWNENGRPDFNYSFQSRLEKRDFMECPKYLQQEGYRVGCRMQYISKFYNLHTKLLANNDQIVSEQEIDLKGLVKLHPPHNLTLHFSNASGLWLYWNISSKDSCTESKVRYRKSKDIEWQESLRQIHPSPYNVPFPDETQLYEFQVQTRISHFCGKSDFWSDWSPPVYWGSNSTGLPTVPLPLGALGVYEKILYPIMGSAVLLTLACLLIRNERLRVILVPITPRPNKNLEDLWRKYNGNVEEWLHIPKDIVDGFRPNFSETACPVREYCTLPVRESWTGSDCSLPMMSDDTDCLSTCSASSSSTLPAPPYDNTPCQV
ncbi:interleukin 2 receptor, gamma b isoform X2 [Amia ocellicauda]|uniref:interleukin 2 receptor, gamma b isoform X2 n=1 Tax=Amia ocellicauda TaxID=2972642 RepID=UPI0034638BDF